MKRKYFVVYFNDGTSFMVYTSQQLSEKMIKAKVDAMGEDSDTITEIRETNSAHDLIVYAKCNYDIDNVYDENQGEGGFQY